MQRRRFVLHPATHFPWNRETNNCTRKMRHYREELYDFILCPLLWPNPTPEDTRWAGCRGYV
jgi:hypothetical protein